MAKKRDLVITIDPDGNVKIEVEGVAGKSGLVFEGWGEEKTGGVTER
ncbi:MAG: DUF2997 domain-containing protein, partial [Myxococcales bacterium]|nr:DUF2997 domain-containing protein [Myxococcales bacterium]